MTTVKVHVDNEFNAQLLEYMLRELSFVEDVEIFNESGYVRKPKGTYLRLKKEVDKLAVDNPFKRIDDPTKWQKDLRDEW